MNEKKYCPACDNEMTLHFTTWKGKFTPIVACIEHDYAVHPETEVLTFFVGGLTTIKLETQTPSDVARERQEAIARDKRAKMLERLAKPLTGNAGDLTADMFGDGQTPLFDMVRS